MQQVQRVPEKGIEVPDTANKGLENVVACTTEISTIYDTTLLYRGYTIEDLANNCSLEEVIYLLWNDKLPTQDELRGFRERLSSHLELPGELLPPLERVSRLEAHSMAKLRSMVSYFGLLDSDADDISLNAIQSKGIRVTAAMGPIVATMSRYEQGRPRAEPAKDRSLAWNLLNMLRGQEPNPAEERLMDVALILHADHELNASAFTARVIASTQSDYYSAITGAIGSLKGPLHGGANEQVMLMLQRIGTYDKVDDFIENAIKNNQKVMGIGHRVYKHGDPRARILRDMSIPICKKAGLEEYHRMLVRIQEQMEQRKGLMPNLDFYSGLVYTSLGLRPRDFTPIFAVSRTSGWTAQVLEQYSNNRLYRPRGYYSGKANRRVIPIDQRDREEQRLAPTG